MGVGVSVISQNLGHEFDRSWIEVSCIGELDDMTVEKHHEWAHMQETLRAAAPLCRKGLNDSGNKAK